MREKRKRGYWCERIKRGKRVLHRNERVAQQSRQQKEEEDSTNSERHTRFHELRETHNREPKKSRGKVGGKSLPSS